MPKIEHKDLVIGTAVPTEKLRQNVLDAAQYNIAPIDNLIGVAQGDRAVALIGGGPSLSDTFYKLWLYRTLIIAGSAHDFVVTNTEFTQTQEIFCILCDPDPVMCTYLKHKNPRITYLIASQCDKTLFEHLSDMPKKYIWHASAGEEFNNVFGEAANLIIGGCTIGTRAIGMAMAMGYKKVHLFGYDSCLSNQYKHHAYDFVNPDVETLGEIREIKLGGPDSPIFRVAGYMLAQIFDFQNILHNYYNKLEIEIYGNGALAYLMKLARQQAEDYKNGNPTEFDGSRSSPLSSESARC